MESAAENLQSQPTLEPVDFQTAFNSALQKAKWILDNHKTLPKNLNRYFESLNIVKETKRDLEKLQREIEKALK
jgi:hypothetical protein